MEVKKSKKADLNKNSGLYFVLGLVLVMVLVDQEVVIHSQDLLRLILQLMVGVTMVEVVVLALIVEEAVAALQVQEEQQMELQQETMVVEVCYSLQHLEIQP